ncbi:unnamed protein product [Scytosiphon promiscuus]
MESVEGKNDRNQIESSSKSSRHGMRRSCETCRRKKKRCDGEQPCSRCVRSESKCIYDKNRWHHCNQPQHEQERRPHQSGRQAVYSREHRFHSTSGALMEYQTLPFKRCRLRASPATGLVGMQENAYLSDFFCCVGFLPLANESQIREAMVKIMIPAAPQQETALGYECGDEDGPHGTLLCESTLNKVSGTNQLPDDPSLCMFWCAVAMGALAKGSPFEVVTRYGQLAREALAASRSGSAYAKLAQASAILAFLSSFMRDAANFCEYLDSSESFWQASIEQGSSNLHSGLPDFILLCREVGNAYVGPMKSRLAHGEVLPQVDTITTKVDVFRFLTQSFRLRQKAVYAKLLARNPGDLEHSSSCGSSHHQSSSNIPLAREMSDAIATVMETADYSAFRLLQDALDRSSARGGMIDLFVNGMLVCESAIKGDRCAALKSLDRSVNTFERYPGLCRCMMSCHTPHMLLAILAEIDDSRAPRMYQRLREAVNSVRASHSMPVPPLDEWQGIAAICTDLECRAVETLVRSGRMKAFTIRATNSSRDSARLPQTASKVQSDKSHTKAAQVMSDLLQACPDRCWTRSNGMSKCAQRPDLAGAPCCASAAVPLPAFRHHPSKQSDPGAQSSCTANGVGTEGLGSFSRNAAWLEDDELAGVDLLDVVNAVVNAVHASGVEG